MSEKEPVDEVKHTFVTGARIMVGSYLDDSKEDEVRVRAYSPANAEDAKHTTCKEIWI